MEGGREREGGREGGRERETTVLGRHFRTFTGATALMACLCMPDK
jgi:hypothetical protein